MTIDGKDNNQNLTIELKTGRAHSRNKSGVKEFISEKIYIAKISNAQEIAKICRQNISKHQQIIEQNVL